MSLVKKALIAISVLGAVVLFAVGAEAYQILHVGSPCASEKSPDGRYTITTYGLFYGNCSSNEVSGYIRLHDAQGRLIKEVYTDGFEQGRLGVHWNWDTQYDAVEVQYSSEGLASTFWLFDHANAVPKPPLYDQHRLNLLIQNGDVQEVGRYLKNGMNMNIADEQGQLPLVRAAYYKNQTMVEYLLSHGADVNAKDGHGSTALHWSRSDSNQGPEITQMLVEHGADVNARDNYGQTPLFTGVRPLSEIEYLVSKGADVRAVNNEGQSVIFRSFSDFETIRYLLDHGASVDFKSPLVPPFLYQAILSGKIDLVRFFEERGADVAAALKIRDAIYPLHHAAQEGDLTTVSYLVEHGMDVNEKDKEGKTALQITEQWIGADTDYRPKLMAVAEYLRKHGARSQL